MRIPLWLIQQAVLCCILMAGCTDPNVPGSPIQEPKGAGLIELPSSVPRFAYDPVPVEERRGHMVEITQDLTIGGVQQGDQIYLHGVNDLEVDNLGNIYVLEYPQRRLQVFDSQGIHIRTLGRQGEGPGEFQEPAGIALVDEFVVVADTGQARVSVWDREGVHRGDWRYDVPTRIRQMDSVRGTAVISYHVRDRTINGSSYDIVLGFLTPRGRFSNEFVRLRKPPAVGVGRSPVGGVVLRRFVMDSQDPMFATSADRIYVSGRKSYQVVCYDASGHPLWQVAVPWERAPITVADKQNALAGLSGGYANADISEISWPELHPSIRRLSVDGTGNLFVFLVAADPQVPGTDPVDIYSPDGERIFTGLIPSTTWSAAHAGYVYGVQEDPTTFEQTVVRYRLVEPF